MKRIFSGALAVAAALTGLTVFASPASAVGSCDPGKFCLFENNDYNQGNTNHWLDLTRDDWDLRNNYWTGSNDSIDNELSSVKNEMNCRVRLWQHVGGTGAHTRLDPGQWDGFLANNAIGDNRASAVDICAPVL
jgi:hypothetical protein